MTESSIFRWRDGSGWLVLSGGGDDESSNILDIDSAVLRRTFSDNPIAYIWAAGNVEDADRYLEHLDELGGRTHFLVDVIMEDDNTLRDELGEAGIIMLGAGANPQRLRNGLSGAALQGISTAYAMGASIYARGAASGVLGSWTVIDNDLVPGLGWIEGAIIMPHYDANRHAAQLQAWLQADYPDAYAIGLAEGAALALSPEGAVEVWGNPQVTVLLGKNLSTP